MKIQTRLITLILLLTAMFGGALWSLRVLHAREKERMEREVRSEREQLLGSVLELTGQSLKNFANDYSLWTEMADFVQKPDAHWAEINIQASLPNFNAHGAWVLAPDGTQVFGIVRNLESSLNRIPVAVPRLIAVLKEKKFVQFYQRTSSGLLEFRAAPIQLSEDTQRQSQPSGWFVVARLWNAEHRALLRNVLDSDVSLFFAAHTDEPDSRFLHRELRDVDGRVVGTLHVSDRRQALLEETDNTRETILFLVFGAVSVLASAISISRWVLQPLRNLERSLALQSTEPLGELGQQSHEFGSLAKLLAASFDQRAQLEREIEERRRAEEALRESREELRNAAEMKSRLGRDLHDGVIQSIYAAGLGLEGVRALLHSNPAQADNRLVAAQTSLNQTIREVRSFIQGLEPEAGERADFTLALRSLIATMRALHPVDLQLRIDGGPPRLNPREEVHALQIVRESISNALRHGLASRIDVVLSLENNAPLLRIRDNGRGFDPAQARPRAASGLANLASRTAEIGAELEIDSSPGKGTGITIRFRHTAAST